MIPLMFMLVLGQALPATALQTDSTSQPPPVAVTRPMPFGAGEKMEYVARYGPTHIGRGRMRVVGIEDIGGRPGVHTNFELKARWLMFSANYTLESWVDQATFNSVRFTQDNDGDSGDRDKIFEIFP